MVARRVDKEQKRPTMRPSMTLEGRENQLIGLAVDLAEKRLLDGTATSQEVTHFLKLGSTREQLEQERIRNENALAVAKIQAIESGVRIEALFEKAIEAMQVYKGDDDSVVYDA